MNSSIRTLLKRYDTYWGATDYQVFRVLSSKKGKVYVLLTYEIKDWYNRDPSLADAKFVVRKRKEAASKKPVKKQWVATDEEGKTDKTQKITGGKYILKQVEAPDGFKFMDPEYMEIKVSSDKTRKITVKCEPKLKFQTVVIKRNKKVKKPGVTTFRIWPCKYGKYRNDEKWWNSIPNGVKDTITFGKKDYVKSKKLPAKCKVFNGIYYIHQVSATKNKYKPLVNKQIQLKKKTKKAKSFKVVLKRRIKK